MKLLQTSKAPGGANKQRDNVRTAVATVAVRLELVFPIEEGRALWPIPQMTEEPLRRLDPLLWHTMGPWDPGDPWDLRRSTRDANGGRGGGGIHPFHAQATGV